MQQLIEDLYRAEGFTAILVTHDVEEAIALADRVVVLEDGKILEVVHVDLPRPRSRSAAAFTQTEEEILSHLLGLDPVGPALAKS
jgi:sulfonate transport system ATP-binding protein